MEHGTREVTFPMECAVPARVSKMAATAMSSHSAWRHRHQEAVRRVGNIARNCEQKSKPGAQQHLSREMSATQAETTQRRLPTLTLAGAEADNTTLSTNG